MTKKEYFLSISERQESQHTMNKSPFGHRHSVIGLMMPRQLLTAIAKHNRFHGGGLHRYRHEAEGPWIVP